MTEPTISTGQRRISALTHAAKNKAEAKARTAAPQWPSKGGAYKGIMPGEWRFDPDAERDDTGFLPADCPVRPLGYDGESYYLIDTLGQVFNTGTSAFGVERMQKLFAGHEDYLYWAWPSFGKGTSGKAAPVNGFKAEEARRDLYAACAARGPWNPTDQVRGRGAWLDDRQRLVLHCGDSLFVDGKEEGTGELGEHFYVRRPKAITPWGEAVPDNDNPALEIFKALCSWNFVRGEVDVMLSLGWVGVAFMGAALDWRPSAFVVGDAGAGKSELQRLFKVILGRFMISTTNATSAGLYQIVGHDALPIGIDELEGEDGQDQAAQIIKMARDAASGSIRIRGGANHQGVEFQARSTFLFSAINPPPIPPASMSRLALLQLRPLDNIEKTKGKAPTLTAPETVGPRLLRRVMDNWSDFPRLYEAYRDVLRDNGHDSRGQNTFGTFLAAAHLLLGDEGMEALGYHSDNLTHWGVMLAADAAPEVSGKTPNWAKCIEELMISQVDSWNKGERRTIGQLLAEIEATKESTLPEINKLLAITGLHVLQTGRAEHVAGRILCVPVSGKDINRLMADSSWGGKGNTGSWNFALSQAPDHIVHKSIPAKSGKGDPNQTTNRISIGGTQRRCLFISLADLKVWAEG